MQPNESTNEPAWTCPGATAPGDATMSGSNLFGEIRRFARTSGAVGGIAARMAGERMFGIKTDRASHAEDLKTISAA